MTRITFYKGLKEIGGTFVAVETEKAVCMFDFGFSVSGRCDDAVRLRQESLVEDYVRIGMLPAADGIYAERPARNLGLASYGQNTKEHFFFISHMHIDHMGGLGMLDEEMPVYMSEDSLRLYRRLCAMGDIQQRSHERCIGIPYGQAFTRGDITVRVLQIDHDVIGASGALITTPDGTIVYTGDYRFHGFYPGVSKAFGETCRGADVMVTEGVTVSFGDVDMLSLTEPEEDICTEEMLQQEMAQACRKNSSLLIVNPYNRNVERIHRLIGTFEAEGRTLVMDPVQADYVAEFYPDDDIRVYEKTMNGRNVPEWFKRVTLEDILKAPGKYVLQLDYQDQYAILDLKDVVSRYYHMDGAPLGSYEESYHKMTALLEYLGVPYQYCGLGGHSRPYYLKLMVDTIGPKTLIPLHSFRPEQVNSDRIGQRILPEEGQTVILEHGECRLEGQVSDENINCK